MARRLIDSYALRRLRVALWSVLPDKPVRRRIQGVDLVLPRRHALPYFTIDGSSYGQNLVRIAEGLAPSEGGNLVVLDVGANIGDSAAQILAAVEATFVCVEPDPRWLPYLDENVGRRPGVSVEPSVLLAEPTAAGLRPVRDRPGTTRYRVDADADPTPSLTVEELSERHPVLDGVRLIKTDTDGFDVALVPALARTFSATRPVIFFEFDPALTGETTPGVDPHALWGSLVELGYSTAAVWHNYGHALGQSPLSSMPAQSRRLGSDPAAGNYWDVAVAHRDDAAGRAVLDALVPQRLELARQ